MKRFGAVLAFALALSFTITGYTGAQKTGWTGNAWERWNRLYDLSTVETVTGEVVGVERLPDMKGRSYGVLITVNTGAEEIAVHLGPAWFVHNQDFDFAPGDRVRIRGSRIVFEGSPALIAAELEKEERLLKLRDEEGFPYWTHRR